LFSCAKVIKNYEKCNFLAIFFGDLNKNIYFCPEILTIYKIIAYRNKLYSILIFFEEMSTFDRMTDVELVQAYIDGNNRAFDELLSRNQDKLFTYILCMVKDENLANDLFQDTFLKVITKIQNHQYTETGKLQWWLMRIAHNVVIDYYRAQKTDKVVDAPKDNDLCNLSSSSVLDDNREVELTNNQTLQQVVFLMESLPDVQREVVYMRYFQNLSFKEIAEETNVSINTSLGRMRYALMNMRKLSREHHLNLCLE